MAGAGIFTALYGYGGVEVLRRVGPDREITQFAELPQVLAEMEESQGGLGQ